MDKGSRSPCASLAPIRNDSQEALTLVDAIPPLQGERGRPRCRPVCVLGDRGYDAAAIRRGLRARHILPLLAMRRTTHGSGWGQWRWVVERTLHGLISFAGAASGTTGGPTSTRRFFPSAVRGSAGSRCARAGTRLNHDAGLLAPSGVDR
jgi:hypothetical protein